MDGHDREWTFVSFFLCFSATFFGKKERKMERQASNVKAIGRESRKKEIKDGKAAERTLK